MKKVLLFFICQLFFISVSAQEISYLDLAGFFIKDKNYNRAQVALGKAYKDLESYSKTRYYLLKGLYHLRVKEFQKSYSYLKKATDGSEEQYLAALYLSEWHFIKKQYQEALEWNLKIPQNELKIAEAFILRAKIFWANLELDRAFKVLDEFYKDELHVRISKNPVDMKNVAGTNFCDIYVKQKGNMLFISSAIDNLMRGASSQAVVNANIMMGLDEGLGIVNIAYVP